MIRFVISQIAREPDRLILWLPVFLAVGIGIYFALPTEPSIWAGPSAVALSGLVLLRRRDKPGSLFVMMFMLCAIGFSAAQFRTLMVAEPTLSKRHGPVLITGRVSAFERMEVGSRVTLERLDIDRLRPDRAPRKVRIRLRGAQPAIEPGAWLSMRAVLTPPPEPAAPGSFDFQRQSFFRGLGAVGFAYGKTTVIAPPTHQGLDAIWLQINRFRTRLQARVTAQLDGERGTVAAALMMGERRAISDTTLTEIRNSGLAHLLAISGLHIGLVAATVFVGLRASLALVPPLALGFPIKKWAAVAAMIAAFLYALVAGGTLPTQRAFLMIAAVFTGVLLDREGLTMRLVAFAATLILLVRPESLLSASFQMSFAAVIGLVAVYEAQMRRSGETGGPDGVMPGKRRSGGRRFAPFRYLFGVAAVSVIATLATAPFVLHHFNQIAVYGVIANLVAVPVTALWVMPWAVVAFLLYPVGLDGVPLTAMGWGVQLVLDIASAIAPLPGAVARLPALPLSGLILAALGGTWLCLWRGRWRYWGLTAVISGLAAVFFVSPPDLLVDGAGRLFAVRGPSGEMAVSNRRAGAFTRGIWLRRAGLVRAQLPWPKPGAGSAQFAVARPGRADVRGLGARADGAAGQPPGLDLRCDGLGCIYHPSIDRANRLSAASGAPVHTVALVNDPLALSEDCGRASVVVATVSIPGWCTAPHVVIDRWDLWRNGTHAFWFDPNGDVRVRSVAQVRGTRPWVIDPGKKSGATN